MYYEQLESYLLDFTDKNSSEDFWYDYAYLQAEELLNNFTQIDWDKLYQNIDSKNNLWKIRVAYCIDEDAGINGFNVLLKLLDGDDEVAEYAIDSLRSFNKECYKKIIISDQTIIDKAETLMRNASLPVKRILEVFLQQNKE